jgi:hypothetical protein
LTVGRQRPRTRRPGRKPSGQEACLAEEIDDLTRALGEAHVELRAQARRASRDGISLPSSSASSTTSLSSSSAESSGCPPAPSTTAARHHAGHQARGRWPTPARDGIRATVITVAVKYPMWGQRKIAWLCPYERGLEVADATCLRILREAGPTLPVDYVRERRDLTGARREALCSCPPGATVWQMDF